MHRQQPSATRFPPALIFGHLLLAGAGLIVWIAYLVLDAPALAWVAFVLLVPVALLGFTMLARWIPTYQASRTAAVGGRPATTGASTQAEGHFPLAVVAGHGLFAVITVVLVLLTALGVGAS